MGRRELRSSLLGAALALGVLPAADALASVSVSRQSGGVGIAATAPLASASEQAFATDAAQVREVLLSDGTAITLGPDAAVVVEHYAYDPAQRAGTLTVRLLKGPVRIVGGVLNNASEILVRTPAGEVRLDNASAHFDVAADGSTRTVLLLGRQATITAAGQSQALIRPGFQSTAVPGGPPGTPSRQDRAAAMADAAAVNPRLPSGTWAGIAGSGTDAGQSGGGNPAALAAADPGAGTSDPPATASGQAAGQAAVDEGVAPLQLATAVSDTATRDRDTGAAAGGQGGSGNPGTGSPGSGPQTPPGFNVPGRPADLASALDPFSGFGPGQGVNPLKLDETPKSITRTPTRSLVQNREVATIVDGAVTAEPLRDPGPSANRLFVSKDPFTQVVDTAPIFGTEQTVPAAIIDSSPDQRPDRSNLQLQYVFLDFGALAIDRVGDADQTGDQSITLPHTLGPSDGTGRISAPFFLNRLAFSDGQDEFGRRGRMVTAIVRDRDLETSINTQSSIFSDLDRFKDPVAESAATFYRMLQAGFSSRDAGFDTVVEREPDNFILIQARPAEITRTRLDDFRARFPAGSDTEAAAAALRQESGFPNLGFGAGFTDADAAAFILDPDRTIKQLLLDPGNVNFTVVSYLSEPVGFTVPAGRDEHYLFAAGDLDAPASHAFAVDRYFLSPGLDGFDEASGLPPAGVTVAAGSRAFLRRETALGLPLVDSGLLIINPAPGPSGSPPPGAQHAMLHADFGMTGSGGGYRASISATIGAAVYGGGDLSVVARTTGTSHDSTAGGVSDDASTLLASDIFSTAAGGGNPQLPRPGRAGYVVLENFDPADAAGGGAERPLGGQADRYAVLRLATATGGGIAAGTRSAAGYAGWISGLAEYEDQNTGRIGIAQADSGLDPGNVAITTEPATNRLAVTAALSGRGGEQRTIVLGGLAPAAGADPALGTSAFLDDGTFAARRSGGDAADVAMITGNLVKAGLPTLPGLPADLREGRTELAPGQPIREYQHVKWGFFFGDTSTAPGGREHLHLGTWAAGRLPDAGSLPSTGTATYTGHAIGNVFSGGNLYTAVGTFKNAWNFGTRSGTAQMSFDGALYSGETRLRSNSVAFDGVVNAAGRQGALHGNFVSGGGDAAAGVAGRFSVRETGGPAYRAAGAFAAER